MRTWFRRCSTLAGLALAATALTATSASAQQQTKAGFLGGAAFTTLMSVNKGAGIKDTDVTLNLNYVEIPVLLRYEFTEGGGPFAYVGPYVGLNVKCNTVVDTLPVPCADQGVDASTDFGGTIGIGFRKEAWGFDIRYDYGFTDAVKDEKGKNSAVMVLLRVGVN
jgi:hypothetical protein